MEEILERRNQAGFYTQLQTVVLEGRRTVNSQREGQAATGYRGHPRPMGMRLSHTAQRDIGRDKVADNARSWTDVRGCDTRTAATSAEGELRDVSDGEHHDGGTRRFCLVPKSRPRRNPDGSSRHYRGCLDG